MIKNILLKIVCILTVAGLNVNIAQCADIVYPKSENVTINAPRTFFIGSENPDNILKINGEAVEIHPSGGFWHTVDLKYGINTFNISNGKNTKVFKIKRPEPIENSPQKPIKLITYNKPITLITDKDNVPLRVTPADSGINRLQHFQKGIKLQAIGEYGNFYKIKLGDSDYSWISKNSVKKIDDSDNNLASLLSYTYSENNKEYIYKIKLTDKIPYILTEYDGLNLDIYNVKNFPHNVFKFHLYSKEKLFGYSIHYDYDNELIISVNKIPSIAENTPLKDIKITIDPGHGGTESGATGCLGDKEKDVNLSIAQKLEKLLTNAGANVYMTRDTDSDISLSARTINSNKNGSHIFISIHNNALPDSLANLKSSGSEAYYYYPQAKILAQKLIEAISSGTGFKNNGVKQRSFAVIRNTDAVSVLLELGYIINPDDNAKLLDEEYQQKFAQSIVNGLENYLNDLSK